MKKYVIILILTLFAACSNDNGYSTPYIPDNYEYYEDGEVETVFENRPDGINIIFIGDGYLNQDLEKTKGAYQQIANENLDYFFSTPPFSEYKEYFNAYIIYTESEKLIGHNKPGETYTALGVIQEDWQTPSRYDTYLLNDYVKEIIPDFDSYSDKHLILLSVKNGNGAWGFYGVPLFGIVPEVMIHEAGHSFAGLGDEYEQYFTPGIVASTEFTANLDTISATDIVKWKHFIGLENYESVGVYEGGGYTSTGIWRPEANSIMRDEIYNSENPHFNAPSREAIVKKILTSVGETYTFEKFLEKDKISLNKINSKMDNNGKKTLDKFLCGNSVIEN